MKSDGGLRTIFRRRIPDFHWQAIETGGTGTGIPDSNYCFNGIEGWIENKTTSTKSVKFRPGQISWIEQRVRKGGRVFIAVRRRHEGGPRKGPPLDNLFLFHGSKVRELAMKGVLGVESMNVFLDGPSNWDWEKIKVILTA